MMKNKAWSIPAKSVLIEIACMNKEEKNSETDGFLTFYEKKRLKDQRQASLDSLRSDVMSNVTYRPIRREMIHKTRVGWLK